MGNKPMKRNQLKRQSVQDKSRVKMAIITGKEIR
jgi:hypothetical protein